MNEPSKHPSGIVWGAATSAYQIEGAVDEDGRGPSIWDRFTAVDGTIRNGDTGATACDFYHRHAGDVALMRTLGLDAFRFSIAWPRVLPKGRGAVNQAGLDFYDRLVDELLAAGIRPYATLYHWDLPQALQDAGGWPRRDTAEAFAEYAAVVAARLGDRVERWATHNEPYCSSWLGHVVGVHAPGQTDLRAGTAAVHHVLLSHGLAVEAVRREAPGAQVGIVIDAWPQYPASDDPRDVAAAVEADGIRNRLFFDPVLRGAYPADVLERLGEAAPPVRDGDLERISVPIDCLGLNNYSRHVVRAGAGGRPQIVPPAPGATVTATGWEVYPDGLYDVLMRLHREYDAPPIVVSENGAAIDDVPGPGGRVEDPERIAYLRGYLDAVARAIEDGAPVEGYFVWSLLDNFEWAEGYSKRFGLVRVDYDTQQRTPKASFDWYRELIAADRAAGAGVGAGAGGNGRAARAGAGADGDSRAAGAPGPAPTRPAPPRRS